MIINRVFARANHNTFSITPIADLLKRYNVGMGWVDPYARNSTVAEITNDIDINTMAQYHLDAEEFVKQLERHYHQRLFKGFLFDPPYSYRQISEHYQSLGLKANQKDTSYNFYRKTMNQIENKVVRGGYVISFGWNSNGFGKSHGFEIVEILLVAHGLHHNDTIVTVETKI